MHPTNAEIFRDFFARPDTFSIGVCNGCQLLTLLGVVGDIDASKDSHQISTTATPKSAVRLLPNECGRFHSYFNRCASWLFEVCVHVGTFPSVRIEKTNAVMLDGMEGSTLGVWCSNGEGRFDCVEEVKTLRSYLLHFNIQILSTERPIDS